MYGLEGIHHQPVHLLLPLVHLHLTLLSKQLPNTLLHVFSFKKKLEFHPGPLYHSSQYFSIFV